ncbi:MAG: 50S ribosomal protein L15 [Deltaproteobacteria bacterium]|nr:50S ribosomal protein L15 [Deltaproteobacteria bacterium]
MRLEDLAPKPGARTGKKRVGRGAGSGLGMTSGRGTKGQKSRSGGGTAPWFEGGQMPLQRRIPKRGFTNRFKKRYSIVNVGDLARFEAGSEVGIQQLMDVGLVRKLQDGIKLLGEGEIGHALTVQVHKASESAVNKVQAAGGRIELIPSPERK